MEMGSISPRRAPLHYSQQESEEGELMVHHRGGYGGVGGGAGKGGARRDRRRLRYMGQTDNDTDASAASFRC